LGEVWGGGGGGGGEVSPDWKRAESGIKIELYQQHWISVNRPLMVMDKTLTPSPWTTPMDYADELP